MRKLTYEEIFQKRVEIQKIDSLDRLPVKVLLENVRSLYNVGSIFRTSDAALITKLILSGFTPYPPRKEIEKTALGSTESVPWEYYKDPLAWIENTKKEGVKICCLELTTKSIPFFEVNPSQFPLCLIVGNEITGVSNELISQCDFGIEIPMYGIKHSLNVAVAYGIAIFELSRLWRSSESINRKRG